MPEDDLVKIVTNLEKCKNEVDNHSSSFKIMQNWNMKLIY